MTPSLIKIKKKKDSFKIDLSNTTIFYSPAQAKKEPVTLKLIQRTGS